jgi:glutamine amidotransferase-like uncharacterized protein
MNPLIPISIAALFLIANKGKSTSKLEKSTTTSITVGLYKSYGVSEISFEAAKALLESTKSINLKILSSSDVRKGKLKDVNVFIAMGGSGSQQGKDLQELGREKVKEFVKNGGGYIGVCGGSYMAITGPSEGKLNMLSTKNYGNTGWQRGNGDCEIKTNDGQIINLHYENGPIFEDAEYEGASPYQSLATFNCDYYIPNKGTYKGEMPGQPAIIVGNYGKGRVLLFSPNPILGDPKRDDMFTNGIKYVNKGGKVKSSIRFSEVF